MQFEQDLFLKKKEKKRTINNLDFSLTFRLPYGQESFGKHNVWWSIECGVIMSLVLSLFGEKSSANDCVVGGNKICK